jgi:hypothetical protein
MIQFKTTNGLTVDMFDHGETDCWSSDGTKFRGLTTRFAVEGESILYSQCDIACGLAKRETEDMKTLDIYLARTGDRRVQ